MKITKLIVENFKSFDRIEFSETSQKLGNVNILVGANASGKSNFITVFEFLKEIKKNGIEKTIKEKFAGFSKLKNFNVNKKSLSIEVEFSDNHKIEKENIDNQKRVFLLRNKITYSISLMEVSKHFDLQEKITFHEKYVLENIDTQENTDLSSEHIYGVENTYSKFQVFSNQKEMQFYKEEFKIPIESPYPDNFMANLNERYQNKSILEYEGVFIPADIFDFGIYDFEPKLAKGARIDMNTEILDKNGENLSLIIKDILKNQDKEQFIADVKYILDFVEDIEVESFGNLTDLKVKEANNKMSTESSLLSEGTISMIAMVVALYYQKNDVIFIEEPERCIHPSLITNLVDMLYDFVENDDKQIIITTHSPEILRANGKDKIENILLIDKKDKFSKIQVLGQNKDALVNAFLQNGVSIDTLFIQNLLDD